MPVATLDREPNVEAAVAGNFDGDATLYQAFAADCAVQFKRDIKTGQRAAECGDLVRLGWLAHDLKSALTLLGHRELGRLAAEVEARAQRGDKAPAREAWRSLRSGLAALHLGTPQEVGAPPIDRELAASAGHRPSLDVLLVEDYEPMAALVRHSLAHIEPAIRLDVVPTVAQALERLRQFEQRESRSPRYDAVLTDLNLPDGRGLDILAHVRSRGLPLAVLILTAADERDTSGQALRAGADAYVAKRDDYLARLPQTLQAAVQRLQAVVEARKN